MKLYGFFSMKRIVIAGALIGALAGCTDFSTTPVSLGRVTVSVTDANNAGVGLMAVDLMLTDKLTLWRSLRTSADGTGEFGKPDGGVKSQMYIVRLQTNNEYQLAENETNDKPVTVVIGQTHPVTFKVVKRQVPDTPPG